MKRYITLILAAFFFTGCNFYTDIDADVNVGGNDDSTPCESIKMLLEAEDDATERRELANAYIRCLDNRPSNNEPCADGDCEVPGNPCPEGDACEPEPNPPGFCDGVADLADCDDLDDETCQELADRCHGIAPPPSFDCDQIRAQVEELNVEVDAENAQFICDALGYDLQTCVRIYHACIDTGGSQNPTDPAPTQCDAVRNFVEEQIEQGSSEEELYAYCLENLSVDQCNELLACL